MGNVSSEWKVSFNSMKNKEEGLDGKESLACCKS